VAAAAVVGGIAAMAARQPAVFRVERSATIEAPPETIFALLNDFRHWPGWSPWEKLDPAMTRTHSGAGSGAGAVYAWEGNKKVGAGRMEITDSQTPSRVTIKLDFSRPFEAHNITELTLEPSGNSTVVRWAMHGPNTFVTKIMGVFMSMDKMVGKDFEAGLANLKGLAEG
jgi:uncharacterized protein YndB with AHSA1/START domain